MDYLLNANLSYLAVLYLFAMIINSVNAFACSKFVVKTVANGWLKNLSSNYEVNVHNLTSQIQQVTNLLLSLIKWGISFAGY